MANKLFETDAEVIVISSILQVPDLVHNIDGLRYYMFSSTPHQTLFEEFEDLKDKQLATDFALVVNSLDSKNLLDKAGGRKYIELLVSKQVNTDTFVEMVKTVVASYKARSLISISSSIDKNKLTSANVDGHLQTMKQSLENLLAVNGQNDTLFLGDFVAEAFKEIEERVQTPGIRGHSWGSAELNKATGGKCGGDLLTIAGRPGMGKTALVMNSVLADGRNNIPSLVIEREMRKQELTERLISLDTDIPNTNIRLGLLNPEQMDKVRESLQRLKKMPIYVDTSYKSSDPYYIESTVNKFRNKHGIEVVYLDYIQILSDRTESQTQEIGQMTRLFKLMSNELGICSIILSQLNRGVEHREDMCTIKNPKQRVLWKSTF
jgi:replicative DNA helicase